MKRIVLHIGTHKTGTTTIQHTLSSNRDNLKNSGVLYPETNRAPYPHQTKHLSLLNSIKDGDDALILERDRLFSEFEASDCHTMILSEEHLHWLPSHKLQPFRHFVGKYEIETVCFLRRQDFLLEAMWAQFIKNGQEKNLIGSYVDSPKMVYGLRYDLALDLWAKFSKVNVLSYDEARSSGLMKAFAQLSNTPILEAQAWHNTSPSANCTLFMTELNRQGISFNMNRLTRAFQNDEKRTLLGRKLRKEVLDSVRECNLRLEHEYGIKFDPSLPDEEDEMPREADPYAIMQAMAVMSFF